MANTPDQLQMTPFYGFFHYLAASVHSMWFRGEVAGTENFPTDGPFLIAANHPAISIRCWSGAMCRARCVSSAGKIFGKSSPWAGG